MQKAPSGIVFDCEGESLVGIVHPAPSPADVGVAIVVGGPQYRIGSHRQFVQLAEALADAGVPCMRFDYRGMGDGTGPARAFDSVSQDIRAALDAFLEHSPAVKRIVLWGLCDGATAAATYAATDDRVCALVLANPWVHTEQGAARTRIRSYYVKRLMSADFWAKLVRGGVDVRASVSEASQAAMTTARLPGPQSSATSLPKVVLNALQRFAGPVLVLLSEHDLTADEFRSSVVDSRQWSRLIGNGRIQSGDLKGADHTFSSKASKAEVAARTIAFVSQFQSRPSPI